MNLAILFLSLFIATGVISFFINKAAAKTLSLLASLGALVTNILMLCQVGCQSGELIQFSSPWLPVLGSTFELVITSNVATLLTLLAIVFFVLFLFDWNKNEDKSQQYYGLMLLSGAGISGVFMANDLLLFYFFWELALIPVYFLCSTYGGAKRIAVTYKFFVYTFLGSLIMLAGILYLSYLAGPTNNALIHSGLAQMALNVDTNTQIGLFVVFFLAFAIKIPVFPFHTWQPDTYSESHTSVTIVLSALMVKMGVFAIYKWILPIIPQGAAYWSDVVIWLCVIGIIYASLLALQQDNMKRMVAYSSIAHMALITAGLFANNDSAMQGVWVQMFNHGIYVAGLWLIISFIENRYQTVSLSELGGMASIAPWASVFAVIIGFASISLPLTNAFVGEFLLFNGLMQSPSSYHIAYMVLAGLGVILGAMYTLRLLQKTVWGTSNQTSSSISDVKWNEGLALFIIVAIILVLGVYPKPLLALTSIF